MIELEPLRAAQDLRIVRRETWATCRTWSNRHLNIPLWRPAVSARTQPLFGIAPKTGADLSFYRDVAN
jgi:hypothetical protein